MRVWQAQKRPTVAPSSAAVTPSPSRTAERPLPSTEYVGPKPISIGSSPRQTALSKAVPGADSHGPQLSACEVLSQAVSAPRASPAPGATPAPRPTIDTADVHASQVLSGGGVGGGQDSVGMLPSGRPKTLGQSVSRDERWLYNDAMSKLVTRTTKAVPVDPDLVGTPEAWIDLVVGDRILSCPMCMANVYRPVWYLAGVRPFEGIESLVAHLVDAHGEAIGVLENLQETPAAFVASGGRRLNAVQTAAFKAGTVAPGMIPYLGVDVVAQICTVPAYEYRDSMRYDSAGGQAKGGTGSRDLGDARTTRGRGASRVDAGDKSGTIHVAQPHARTRVSNGAGGSQAKRKNLSGASGSSKRRAVADESPQSRGSPSSFFF